VWDVRAVDYRKGYSITLAPLGDQESRDHRSLGRGIMGFADSIDAYDAATGEAQMALLHCPRSRASRGHENVGKATRGKSVGARPRGSQGNLRSCNQYNLFGRRVILPPSKSGRGAGGGTISTAILCWR